MPRLQKLLTAAVLSFGTVFSVSAALAQDTGSSLVVPNITLPASNNAAAPSAQVAPAQAPAVTAQAPATTMAQTGTTAPIAAADTTGFPDPSKIEALDLLRQNGAQLIPITRAHGMYVWAAIMQGKFQMIYTTADNSAALVGIMFGKGARLETAEHMEQLRAMGVDLSKIAAAVPPSAGQMMQQQAGATAAQAPAPAPISQAQAQAQVMAQAQQAQAPSTTASQQSSPAEQLLQEVESAKLISAGNTIAPTINIVVDPSCPYCKAYWTQLRPYVERGTLHVNLIPVGLISETSAIDAAKIMSTAQPLQAWNDHVSNMNSTENMIALPEVVNAIGKNTGLIRRWSIPAVPYSIYRNRSGKIMVVTGQPENLQTILDDVLGK